MAFPPAPERKTTTTWKEFIRTHMDVLVATDFFTAEVWTLGGLVTYYVLFFIHLGSRKVHVAGVTPHPNEAWMVQVARNVTMEEWGFLSPGQYLIHDRDTKFCAAFQQIIDDAGVERVVLPPRSPNLNAYAERWVRSVKEECLSRLILFGEASLRHALDAVCGRIIITSGIIRARATSCSFLRSARTQSVQGPMQCRERLGGLLKYYDARGRMSFLTIRGDCPGGQFGYWVGDDQPIGQCRGDRDRGKPPSATRPGERAGWRRAPSL